MTVKISVASDDVTPIVGDGAIAGPSFGGKLVAVLILDTRKNSAATEAIRISKYLPPGDMKFAWGRSGKVPLLLSIQLIQPMAARLVIPFDIRKHATLIELILASGGVYIQAGQPGDRIKHNIDADKLALELANTGFESEWPKLYQKTMVAHFQRLGRSKRDALQLSEQLRTTFKDFARLRLPTGGTEPEQPSNKWE